MKQFPSSIRELSCLPFSDANNALSLSAGVAKALEIPAGAKFVVFSANADFYVKADGTAAVPGDVTDGTAPELNPTMRSLAGVGGLSVISASSCIVTASFYGT